jgi:hypothetical protein
MISSAAPFRDFAGTYKGRELCLADEGSFAALITGQAIFEIRTNSICAQVDYGFALTQSK